MIDDKKRMEWQAEFLNRPEIAVEALPALNVQGLMQIVHSFKLIGMPDEITLVVRTDKGVQLFRVNPEVSEQLAMSLITLGTKLGFHDIHVQRPKGTRSS